MDKNLVTNLELSDEAVAVYIALKKHLVNGVEEYYVTPASIWFSLTGSVSPSSRRMHVIISNGIRDLQSFGIIQSLEISKAQFVIDTKKLFFDSNKNPFINIENGELFKIMNSPSGGAKLLRYYITTIGSLSNKIEVFLDSSPNRKNVVGNLSIQKLSEMSGVSYKSAVTYNKLLENLHLLYVFRYNDSLSYDNSYPTNVYGRYDDMEYVKSYAKNHARYHGIKVTSSQSKNNSNRKRRLAQMYNALHIYGKEYNADEIREIYGYVMQNNKILSDLAKSQNDESHLSKLRDISIFNKYDFLFEKTKE